MRISVCCPSYKRPKVETLKYLPFLKVYVDTKEYQDYIESNKGFENNIVECPKGIQGNVSRVRNYILDCEFKSGADAVCIVDDDLKGIYRYNVDEKTLYGYVKEKIEKDDFIEFIEKYTEICKDLGYNLWGVNCNSDALSYRHYTPFSLTSIVLGPFSVHLKESEVRYDEELPLKEDYDLAIQHLNKYRGILRLNGYFYDCKQSENKGGCATYRNMEREREQFELLRKKWGSEIIKYDKGKRAGSNKQKMFDYNPIISIPIKGV